MRSSSLWMRSFIALRVIVFAPGILFAVPATADDNFWDGKGSGNWSDPTRWSLGRSPTSADRAFIGGSPGFLGNQTVSLNAPSNAALSLSVSGNSFFTNSVSSGPNTALNLSGDLTVADFGRGAYDLTGSTLNAVNEYVGLTQTGPFGVPGIGTFTQIGGFNTVSGDLFVGACNGCVDAAGGTGTYNLGGGAVLRVGGSEHVGVAPFPSANTATFEQSGGLHTISNVLLIGQQGGTGTYRLSGNAELDVGGGSAPGVGGVSLGDGSGVATFVQSGGQLTTDGERISANAVFTLNAGTDTVNNPLFIDANGKFNLTGGTLNASPLVINQGQFNYSSGTINANFSNSGTVNLSGGGTRIFSGNVDNEANGIIKSTNTSVKYTGTFTNKGTVKSDPATNLFGDLVNGNSGVMQGGKGDVFSIAGDFVNHSEQNTIWNTDLAILRFTGSGHHEFDLAGSDFGSGPAGFVDNFAFGILAFDPGVILDLMDGNDVPGAAIRELDLPGQDLGLLADIDSPFNIYYDISDPANAYLGGLDFALRGGGMLVAGSAPPLPEPPSWVLLAFMLTGIGILRGIQEGRKDSRSCGGFSGTN